MIEKSLKKLMLYCESEKYMGWDPYDGLNSKIFKLFGLNKVSLFRLIWIQFFKRSPINFRRLFLVPKEYNSKGLALMISGYCNLFDLCKSGNDSFGTMESLKNKINFLCNLLINQRNKNFSGACWGYNFDWQSRLNFLFKKNQPTVVATSFCCDALIKAYEITKNKHYLEIALSSADFVFNDLSRTKCKSGIILSYSISPGNNTVFNASLLGAKILSQAYSYSRKNKYKDLANLAVRGACEYQNKNGSWVYGLLKTQSWIDSFHTGYNLVALNEYQNLTSDYSFNNNIKKGLDYYLNNFFETSGVPKYYHDMRYPIDIHCPGQLFVLTYKFNIFDQSHDLQKKVANWTINNMQSKKGYFYYQNKKIFSSKISYMRWNNAFMFNSLSYYLLSLNR